MPVKVYSAVIVDDEAAARQSLKLLLQTHCPHVQVVAEAQNVPEALRVLQGHRPAMVFLDITMPNYNGFELLNALPSQNFAVVFVTGYSDYALKAFEVAAQDYILKPIDELALIRTVERAISHYELLQAKAELEQLRSTTPQPTAPLMVPSVAGTRFIPTDNIVFLAAEGAYTRFELLEGAAFVASRVLKSFEKELPPQHFLRVHRSFLLNQQHVTEFSRRDGGLLRMVTGQEVPISRSRLPEVLQRLGLR